MITVLREPNFIPGSQIDGCLHGGGGRLSPPPSCVWHRRRAALLSGALPPRHGTTARAHPPHPSVHASPAQPASAHAATSAVARCWEGNLVGGWRAGAPSSTPLMRSRTKEWSSSASVAHTYTPLGRSRGALVLRLDHDQGRVGDRLLSRGLLHGVCGLHELYRVPLRCTPPSNPNSTLLISCVLLRAPPIPPAPR